MVWGSRGELNTIISEQTKVYGRVRQNRDRRIFKDGFLKQTCYSCYGGVKLYSSKGMTTKTW